MGVVHWSEAEKDLLTQLWDESLQLSATDIADRINMTATKKKTRNAVIGKAHRMGLALKKKPRPRAKPRPSRALSRHKLPPTPVEPTPIAPIPGGVHIRDLEHHHCRSIIGYGTDGLARYCGGTAIKRPRHHKGSLLASKDGRPIYEQTSWCAGHAAVYLQPPR